MDYPYNIEHRTFVPLNVHYLLNIIPDIILADEDIGHYPLKGRKCFIQEKEWNHIKTFKVSYL